MAETNRDNAHPGPYGNAATGSGCSILPFTEHLDELRRRLLHCVWFILAGTIVSLFFGDRIIAFLTYPSHGLVTRFTILKPAEIVSLYVKAALAAGIFAVSPLLFHQFWLFIRPAVPVDLRRSLPAWVGAAFFLFLAGCVFTYTVVLPFSLRFLLGLAGKVAEPMITLSSYLSFILSLLVLGGIMFEIPVIAAVLTRAGIVNPAFLRRHRKEVYFGICVAAAVLTPTPDAFTMLIFVAPMILLFEAGIVVSSYVEFKTVGRIDHAIYPGG